MSLPVWAWEVDSLRRSLKDDRRKFGIPGAQRSISKSVSYPLRPDGSGSLVDHHLRNVFDVTLAKRDDGSILQFLLDRQNEGLGPFWFYDPVGRVAAGLSLWDPLGQSQAERYRVKHIDDFKTVNALRSLLDYGNLTFAEDLSVPPGLDLAKPKLPSIG